MEPFEKDVLRDALQFEPVSDWARGHFKQFKELSDAVKTHWEKASASRARLANRHRRTVDLKVGNPVVWNSPTLGAEGGGAPPLAARSDRSVASRRSLWASFVSRTCGSKQPRWS